MALFDKNLSKIGNNQKIEFDNVNITGLNLGELAYIEYSTRLIFERVFNYVLNDLGVNKESVLLSAYDKYTPLKTRGFLYYLSYAITQRTELKIEKNQVTEQNESYYIFKDNLSNSKDLENNTNIVNFDFTDYNQTELIKSFNAVIYQCLTGIAKKSKASKSLLIKLEELNKILASQKAAEEVKNQVEALKNSLEGERVGYISGNSEAQFLNTDIEIQKESINIMYQLIAMVFGLPVSVINGIGGSSLSDTGESDRKQLRNAKQYIFSSIIKPLLIEIYKDGTNWQLSPEIEDITGLTDALNIIDTTEFLTDAGREKILLTYGLTPDDYDFSKLDFNQTDYTQPDQQTYINDNLDNTDNSNTSIN